MWTLLGSVAAAIVNVLLGRFFPGHPKVTPEVVAQAQRDRADVLQSQKDASKDGEKLRQEVRVGAGLGPASGAGPVVGSGGSLLKHDANELPPE